MANLSYIPSFYFYRFADAVSGPYTALNAYSSGLIDARGNIKGSESSIDPFEYFVIKIKKIFDQLPPGTTKYKLQNLMGTLQVFNEEAEQFGITKEQFNCLVESHVMLNAEDGVSYLNLLEDMSTGSAGGGPGTLGTPAEAPGANKGNVSGYDPVMGSMLTRSSPVNMFPSIEMFNVSKDEFNAFKAAKAWKQLQDSKTKKYLQRFQRRNKAGKMAVRDEESGEIFFIPYKEKSLVEEFGLERLDILKETTESFIEPETDRNGNTRPSEVRALDTITSFLKKQGFEHIPWGDKLSKARQFSVSPGGSKKQDISITNSDGEQFPLEVKSISSGPKYSAFNSDLSAQFTPKGVANFASVAHGLVDIADPEFYGKMDEILRGAPLENVKKMIESQGKQFQLGSIPKISYRELDKKVGREKTLSWRTGLLDMAGKEKGGVVLAINPEQRHLHALTLEPGKAIERLLIDLRLRPTGTASTPAEGVTRSGMHLPTTKMAKTSKSKRMLRTDYRFSPSGEITDPWISNGDLLRGIRDTSWESRMDASERLQQLTRAED
ncbi:MAG: hypothetical protein H7831_06535 [Magnetococcus sp. WYHC-3]